MNNVSFNPGKFNITYDEMVFSYQSEIERFINIFNSKELCDTVKPYYSDNENNSLSSSQLIKIPSAIRKQGLINLSTNTDKYINRILAYAQIGASCHMLSRQTIPFSNIKPGFSSVIARAIVDGTIKSLGDNAHKDFIGDIHIADTIRIIRFLQIAGLLKLNKESCHQLSLGSYTGLRDLNAIHSNQQITQTLLADPTISFKSNFASAKHTVLIDLDETLASLYEDFNQKSPESILAINDSAQSGLTTVAKKISNNKLSPRNLVMCIRIDPRMIPDAADFFALVAATINDNADLVMSFGAGNTLDEFIGRIRVFDAVEKHLKDRGMSPVRIRMYDDSSASINEHRSNPLFAITQFASHEVLYCKLKRKLLCDS